MSHTSGRERPTTWEPGPSLTSAVLTTLRALSRRWRTAMALALAETEAGREYMHDFAYALRDIDPRVLPGLARDYLAGHEFPPGPFELRVEALRMQDRDYPQAAPPAEAPPPVDLGRDDARIARINRHLLEQLGSHTAVARAWEHMGATADLQAFQRVKAGKVTKEAIAAAIVAVRGSQPRRGPSAEVSA
jgi:hypothetical protein